MFRDRVDAGRKLARELETRYKGTDAVVLAIPRGGVVIGHEIAHALGLELDVIIPRKIGAPGNPELAIGAIAQDQVMINEMIVRELGIPKSYIEEESQRQLVEIERRRRLYLGDRDPVPLNGRVAIIVDDGLATGYTALAAVKAIKAEKPRKVVLAVPVAPVDSYERLKREVDEMVCLEVHELFYAVGQFYEVFDQVEDDEVVNILKAYRQAA